jgi:hypothetical protein
VSSIRKFRLCIPEEELDDLRRRLSSVRWPEAETVTDWSQGVPLARMRALAEYWASSYGRRRWDTSPDLSNPEDLNPDWVG